MDIILRLTAKKSSSADLSKNQAKQVKLQAE